MQKEQQQLAELVKGKKVAFIGAGVSHKTLIEEFVAARNIRRKAKTKSSAVMAQSAAVPLAAV